MILSTREIAIIIWTVIFIVLGIILLKDQRKFHITNILKAFWKVISHPVTIVIFTYTLGILYILFLLNIITYELIKDYIKLVLFGLIPMIDKVITNYRNVSILNMLVGLIKFSIIPLFIISEYTFNIYIELILVLIASLLVMLIAVSETRERYKPIKVFLNWCLSILGITIAIFAFKAFYINIDDIFQLLFWKKMFFELLLFLNIPLLLFLQYFAYYEQIITLLKVKKSKIIYSRFYKAITTLIVFKNCLLSKTKLDNASKKIMTLRINSYRELNDMLSNI